MRYFIMGGTGFVGGFLIDHLLSKGHKVEALARQGSSLTITDSSLTVVFGNALKEGAWQEQAAKADVVVNLVGSNIMVRWTEEVKKRIMDTRVISTRMVVRALAGQDRKAFVCANAVGFYGDRGDEILDETSTPGDDFLAQVAISWQAEAEKASQNGHRVVVARFAPVLGPGGGVIGQMLPIFKKGLGGKLGSGNQWFPWVHVRDLSRAIEFVAQKDDISGPVNVSAPETLTNAEFTKALAGVLHRPAIFPVPAFALKLAIGQSAQAVLASARMRPKVLEDNGFSFDFPELNPALKDIVG